MDPGNGCGRNPRAHVLERLWRDQASNTEWFQYAGRLNRIRQVESVCNRGTWVVYLVVIRFTRVVVIINLFVHM